MQVRQRRATRAGCGLSGTSSRASEPRCVAFLLSTSCSRSPSSSLTRSTCCPQTILDDLDTLLSLLALPLAGPTTRRLALPARELAKLGPNPALQSGRSALLFVPLVVPGSTGSSAAPTAAAGTGAAAATPKEQWFVAFVLFEEGLRAALVRAREASDGMNAFLEVGEVGWLGRAEGAASAGAGSGGAEGGRAGEGEGARKGANLGYEVRGETVLGLWGQCVCVVALCLSPLSHALLAGTADGCNACAYSHRVALFDLERQLSARRIPYRLSTAPPSTSAPAPPPPSFLGKDPTTTPRPFLLVHSAALVRLPEAERFVARDAALQCAVDAQGRIRVRRSLLILSRALSCTCAEPSLTPSPPLVPPNRQPSTCASACRSRPARSPTRPSSRLASSGTPSAAYSCSPSRTRSSRLSSGCCGTFLALSPLSALLWDASTILTPCLSHRAYALALRTVTAAAHAAAAAAAAAAQPTSPSKKRSGGTTATPKGQLKGLPNGTGA